MLVGGSFLGNKGMKEGGNTNAEFFVIEWNTVGRYWHRCIACIQHVSNWVFDFRKEYFVIFENKVI